MRKDGFSILEVLIALVVFTIGIGSLLTATGYNMRDISAAKDHGRAIRIAEREMATLRRETELPDELTEGSEDGFSWTATAEELDLNDLPEMGTADDRSESEKPALIQVEVRWGINQKVKLQAYEIFTY